MSSSRCVKSPRSVEDVPTSMLLPAVLARIWSRSAKKPTGSDSPGTVRVQNVIALPFSIVTTGVTSQLLIVPTSPALSKLAAM